ncbi:hypothetical protein KUTeg_003270 [Tegillarca granosa]|uniref:Isovaleryl-CoA dehydrogenase n=1 Tax=Tegillarca granosa TaxID=220873 RepID=A0ABQ9FLP7_TEGGR|nr:hypothetical protein KUTeg_003270 [Tegillarca granosa]
MFIVPMSFLLSHYSKEFRRQSLLPPRMATLRFTKLLTKQLLSQQTSPSLARTCSYFPINDSLFGLKDEQKQLRETVFQFCQKELAPKAAEIDKTNTFPEIREFFQKCGELGLNGMTSPAKYGGSEMSYLDHCIVAEEMSRASASIALSYGAHSNLCVDRIAKMGSEEQKEKYLPDVFFTGDYYVLNGNKFWITNGPIADTLVVYAKTNFNADKPQHGITAFLVERGMDGFSSGPSLDKLGMRGSPTGELIFEDCKVPVENVLGEENRGVYILMSGLDYERALAGSCCVGIMQSCCDVAFNYAHLREAFGQKIGEFQVTF